MSMKKSNDTIGNRNRDLTACSGVPQPTAPPRAPHHISHAKYKYISDFYAASTNCAKIMLLISMLHISNDMEYFVL
jgi:hypothetical protein